MKVAGTRFGERRLRLRELAFPEVRKGITVFCKRPSCGGRRSIMPEGYRRCSGMDVHKETVVVCVLPPEGKPGIRELGGMGTYSMVML